MNINTATLLLGAAGAGGKQGYFTTFTSSAALSLTAIDTANGYAYAGGRSGNSFIMSIDTLGAVSWQKNLNSANVTHIKVSSYDSNVYVGHCIYEGGGSAPSISKIQKDGTNVWHKLLTADINYNGDVRGIDQDSSGNIYVGGFITYGYGCDHFDKFPSTLNSKTWSYTPYTSGTRWSTRVKVNGANVHFGGASGTTQTHQSRQTKTDSNGNQLYGIQFGIGNQWHYDTVWDSNMFSYAIASFMYPDELYITRAQSEPTWAWQNTIIASAIGGYPVGAATNSLNELYVVCNRSIGSNSAVGIIKMNASNTMSIVWERSFKYTGGALIANQCIADDDYLYICGHQSVSGANNKGFVLKVPTDGTCQGTYGNYVYGSELSTTFTRYASLTPGSYGMNGWYDIPYISPSTYTNNYITSSLTTVTTTVG